jgi:SAM-dependent methyltransferase
MSPDLKPLSFDKIEKKFGKALKAYTNNVSNYGQDHGKHNGPPAYQCCPYVAMYASEFARMSELALRACEGDKSFIDAGCGPGFTLELAKAVGFKTVDGVELHKYHSVFAEKRGHKIHKVDMREFDYTPYSVIYSYVPIPAFDEWTRKVAQAARVGTVFVSRTGWSVPFQDQFQMIATQEQYQLIFRHYVIKKIKE